MKTCPSPPSGIHGPAALKGSALTDAVLAASEAVDQAALAAHKPLGVIPFLYGDVGAGPMSLGTRRLCSDQTSPSLPTTSWQSLTDGSGGAPVACIEWNRVTFYREANRTRDHSAPSLFRDQNLTRGSFNGYMSPATRRKVRRIVSTWIRSVMLYRAEVKRKWDPGRAYPVFVTLTLPIEQQHTDAEINRACLQPFLVQLRRDYGVENYFWRAEAQENGNVHFHLLLDRFVPARYLQLEWNARIDALGYLYRYACATGSFTPPSTEVHRIRETVKDKRTGEERTVDPVDYLVDYVMDTPQPEPEQAGDQEGEPKPRKLIGRQRLPNGQVITYVTRAITGRVWGMSDSLREIREPRAEATMGLVETLEAARRQGIVRRIDTDHATMYFGAVSLAIGRRHPGMWQVVKNYYLQVFGYLYPDQLPKHHLERFPPLDPRGLWVDLENFALWHRLRIEGAAPVFETAAELDQWIASQRTKQSKSNAA